MSTLALLRQATGLNLSRATVERAVRQRMETLGAIDREAYQAQLSQGEPSRDELAALIELVVVPESWLFRDAGAFAVATEFAKARLAGGARLVRLLSIPCAGGEEPYSLAMALADAGVAPTAFAIDAIDLSAACIARAEAGIFGRNAFRSKNLSFRDRHFTPVEDEQYAIDAGLRRRVRFRQGNLLTSEIAAPRTYDVIFCRNLLIYFDAETTAVAIGRLAALLADDGVMLAGYAEVPSFTRNGFTALPYRQAFALRKAAAPDTPGTPVWARLPLPRSDNTAAAPDQPAPARPRTRPPARPPVATTPVAPASAPPAPPAPAPAPSSIPTVTTLAPVADLAQARLLADQGRPAEAETACRTVLAQQPDNAEAWFLLGLLAEGTRPEDAQRHLRRCIYLQPDHYDALCHLALLAGQHGDTAGAATLKARAARVWRRRNNTSKHQ
ncbi:CheR family methyltransferase [Pseudoduganella chitinolytica]|uniref:Tetratricopeptide repeat protein n=1 Tax=Pseudoduganella chitinolytica TaxID=34070 RepID=A0ABY8BMP4_9BURK|nr:CheR family methyltransferase [Pseudoduganella chitinolytica]WEF35574.1 tetratricopeptide repeat protein [Pseudoduganella chitinolytica]